MKQESPCKYCNKKHGFYEKKVRYFKENFNADGVYNSHEITKVTGGIRKYCRECHGDITYSFLQQIKSKK